MTDTMVQSELFVARRSDNGKYEAAEGERQREEAISQVEAHAESGWLANAMSAIRLVARSRERFTTDAVWAVLDTWKIPPPHEERALGAAMRNAQKNGVCQATDDWSLSVRAACHRRPLRVWRSLLRE